jgi:hypothetical protein
MYGNWKYAQVLEASDWLAGLPPLPSTHTHTRMHAYTIRHSRSTDQSCIKVTYDIILPCDLKLCYEEKILEVCCYLDDDL